MPQSITHPDIPESADIEIDLGPFREAVLPGPWRLITRTDEMTEVRADDLEDNSHWSDHGTRVGRVYEAHGDWQVSLSDPFNGQETHDSIESFGHRRTAELVLLGMLTRRTEAVPPIPVRDDE
ncbi:hypothetical protein SAMN05216388_102620 [Halorientalis persicus]|uniref:Uncharacterized protein n=1 Tax=Halorientalis persicus TaxID=1367881 RepID=A0A1H8U826_9EURY|nr:hypothetical protein [Halorientalis persicus]SEO99420.1 hypothetical protein SAMN05216388_102620 [Halorientalis persicus]